jgi:hypothetical protein
MAVDSSAEMQSKDLLPRRRVNLVASEACIASLGVPIVSLLVSGWDAGERATDRLAQPRSGISHNDEVSSNAITGCAGQHVIDGHLFDVSIGDERVPSTAGKPTACGDRPVDADDESAIVLVDQPEAGESDRVKRTRTGIHIGEYDGELIP